MIKNKFKSYDECIKYLFRLERAGIKYDLKNIRSLLDHLNNPQNHFKSIHVAGTNGKGSVSSILNSFLIEGGCRSGLYTSPHINDFRERISVDGKFISKKFIVDFVTMLFEKIEKTGSSFFEVTTAMAFEYFRYKKAEYAVIETGLGGRLDSTNILTPVISVITSISIDHTNFLGNTISSITKEKGGIIKKNVPVIVGNVPASSEQILGKIAKEKNSDIEFSDKQNKVKITRRTEKGFYFKAGKKLRNIFFPLTGDYQKNNIATAFKVINKLSEIENIAFDIDRIRRTLRNLKINSNIFGRFELISGKPKIIIDVSHNPQAIENIKSNLKYFKFRKLFIIFAMVHDKDYRKSVRIIEQVNAKIIFTKPAYHRFAEAIDLYNSLRKKTSKHVVISNLSGAFEYAKNNAGRDDMILVTGSFFLVSDFLKLVK